MKKFKSINDTFESSHSTFRSIGDSINSSDAKLARYKTLGDGCFKILNNLSNTILHRLLFYKT